MGPEVKPALPTLFSGAPRVWPYKGARELTKADLEVADAVVLFNPGAGHPNLHAGCRRWRRSEHRAVRFS